MNVTIDREGYIQCSLCADTCPSVFRMSEDDGLAEVFEGPAEADEEAVQEAADGCPVSVIQISE